MRNENRKSFLARTGLALAFIFLTMLCPKSALAQGFDISALDIVVDLDGTLLDTVTGPISPEAFLVEGKWYRFRSSAASFVDELRSLPGARISFFSGGDRSRNIEILRHLVLADGRLAGDIAYRNLGFEDMTKISSDTAQRFIYKYKKDLRKVNPDLRRLLHIDDIPNFFLAGQEANGIWLDPNKDSKSEYDRIFSMIQKVEKDSRMNPFSFTQSLVKAQGLPLCREVFAN